MSELVRYLIRAGAPFKERGTGVGANHVNINCPWHTPRDVDCLLGIELTKLYYHCWFCGTKGGWGKLSHKLAEKYPTVSWRDLKAADDAFYTDRPRVEVQRSIRKLYKPLDSDDSSRIQRAAWNYLTKTRGLEPEYLAQWEIGVGIDDLDGYVCFPQGEHLNARYFGAHNRPRYQRRGPRDQPFLYGAPQLLHYAPEWVVIVEGTFDVFALPIGNAVAILGSVESMKWLSAFVEAAPSVKDVILCLDKTVKAATVNKIAFNLDDCGFTVHRWNWPATLYDWKDKWGEEPKDLDEVRVEYDREHLVSVAQGILHGGDVAKSSALF